MLLESDLSNISAPDPGFGKVAFCNGRTPEKPCRNASRSRRASRRSGCFAPRKSDRGARRVRRIRASSRWDDEAPATPREGRDSTPAGGPSAPGGRKKGRRRSGSAPVSGTDTAATKGAGTGSGVAGADAIEFADYPCEIKELSCLYGRRSGFGGTDVRPGEFSILMARLRTPGNSRTQ